MSTNPNNTYEEWLTAIASTNLNRQFSAEGTKWEKHEYVVCQNTFQPAK